MVKNECCKLPIEAQQEIKSYNKYALPLCAMYSKSIYYPWILNNFLKIRSAKSVSVSGNLLSYEIGEGKKFPGFVDYSDIFHVEKIKYSEISFSRDFFKEKIKDGFYLYFEADEYYIAAKDAYKKSHLIHPSLLYGYDDYEEIFHAVGFTSDLFETFIISYSDFKSATENSIVDQLDDPHSHGEMCIFSLKFKEPFLAKELTLDDFKESLVEYLKPRTGKSWIYGYGVNSAVAGALKHPFKDSQYIKYNTAHLLAEHKLIFRNAMDHVISRENSPGSGFESFQEEYNKVFKLYQRFRLLHMEAAMTDDSWPYVSNEGAAKLLQECLREAALLEKDVLMRLLKFLDLN
jgi:hypothetical protein